MSDTQNTEAAASQSSSTQRDSMGAAEVLEQLLAAFRAGKLQTLIDLMAEDAVMEFPFAPAGRPRRVEGKSNIIKYNQTVMGAATLTSFTDIELHRTDDPDCVVVEMVGHGTVHATGATFERRYIDVVHTKNGHIQLFRDYWNPQESPVQASSSN